MTDYQPAGATPPPAPGYAPAASPAPGYTPAPAYAAAPGYAPGYPAQAPPAASGGQPASGLAISGLIFAFVAAPIGLILSIIALVIRRKARASIALPLAGLIISVIVLIGIGITIAIAVGMLSQLAGVCAELGPGVWEANGVTYTCG